MPRGGPAGGPYATGPPTAPHPPVQRPRTRPAFPLRHHPRPDCRRAPGTSPQLNRPGTLRVLLHGETDVKDELS